MAVAANERRLAAILAADVVCYSRMMAADEAGMLARLRAARRDVVDPLMAEFKGRVFNVMGDGLLAEFPSTGGARHRPLAPGQPGHILSNYVAKYFDDMWEHFNSLPKALSAGAEAHYIVGNSTFYGVVLHVEQIYAAMMKAVGFDSVECCPIRKRNSKKELIEFDVTGRWRS
jgi:hypothetical protein